MRLTGILLVIGVVALTAYCEPVLKEGWRETNDRDQTEEGAYWKARGFVREEVKKQDATVAFGRYKRQPWRLPGRKQR